MDDEERATSPATSTYRAREVLAPPQPIFGRQHDVTTCVLLRGKGGAALATTVREDRATGTGTHPQAEAVGLGTTAVVRLEGALAHSGAPENESLWRDIAWLSPCAHEETRVFARVAPLNDHYQ